MPFHVSSLEKLWVVHRFCHFGPITICTRCGSHFENLPSMALPRPHDNAPPLPFRLQIALDLSYLEPEGQGRGIIMRVWRCHRRQGVKNSPRTCKKSTKNAFRGERAWRPPETVTPTFKVSNKSWDPGLSADVAFVSVLAMVLSEYWKRLEETFCFFQF